MFIIHYFAGIKLLLLCCYSFVGPSDEEIAAAIKVEMEAKAKQDAEEREERERQESEEVFLGKQKQEEWVSILFKQITRT